MQFSNVQIGQIEIEARVSEIEAGASTYFLRLEQSEGLNFLWRHFYKVSRTMITHTAAFGVAIPSVFETIMYCFRIFVVNVSKQKPTNLVAEYKTQLLNFILPLL